MKKVFFAVGLVGLLTAEWLLVRRYYRDEFQAVRSQGHIDANYSTATELDMLAALGHAELAVAARETMIAKYKTTVATVKKIDAELVEAKRSYLRLVLEPAFDPHEAETKKELVLQLAERRWRVMLASMEEIGAIMKPHRVDRNYLYRSFLREHRRTIPGFDER